MNIYYDDGMLRIRSMEKEDTWIIFDTYQYSESEARPQGRKRVAGDCRSVCVL